MIWLIKMQKKFEVFAVASQRIKAGQFSGHPTKNGLVERSFQVLPTTLVTLEIFKANREI